MYFTYKTTTTTTTTCCYYLPNSRPSLPKHALDPSRPVSPTNPALLPARQYGDCVDCSDDIEQLPPHRLGFAAGHAAVPSTPGVSLDFYSSTQPQINTIIEVINVSICVLVLTPGFDRLL